jgi:dCMP deaminase
MSIENIPIKLNAFQKAIEFGILFSGNNNKQKLRDYLYMDIAQRIGQESASRRAQVGALIVKNDNMVSYGWNGMPTGMDNNCEFELPNGELKTRPEVIHAEANAFLKLARDGGAGVQGATLYCTWSPCPRCAGEIRTAGIARIVYVHEYRDTTGKDMLKSLGVSFTQLKLDETPGQEQISTPLEFLQELKKESTVTASQNPIQNTSLNFRTSGRPDVTFDTTGSLSGPGSVSPSTPLRVISVPMTPEQHSKNIEQYRRERCTMDARPVVSDIAMPEGHVFDYAGAGVLVEMGMHHLNESLPNGQKLRSEEAFKALEQGVEMMRNWLRAKGYSV